MRIQIERWLFVLFSACHWTRMNNVDTVVEIRTRELFSSCTIQAILEWWAVSASPAALIFLSLLAASHFSHQLIHYHIKIQQHLPCPWKEMHIRHMGWDFMLVPATLSFCGSFYHMTICLLQFCPFFILGVQNNIFFADFYFFYCTKDVSFPRLEKLTRNSRFGSCDRYWIPWTNSITCHSWHWWRGLHGGKTDLAPHHDLPHLPNGPGHLVTLQRQTHFHTGSSHGQTHSFIFT